VGEVLFCLSKGLEEEGAIWIGCREVEQIRCARVRMLMIFTYGFKGAKAAQVVPHVHFHIIPRLGDVPEIKSRSWTVFGKGQREELDEDDAVVLAARMREELVEEVRRVKEREGVDLDAGRARKENL